tara:strand:- start:1281 stop:1442 length:162 start_codon:yes stop_codon:yes gene_type:complete
VEYQVVNVVNYKQAQENMKADLTKEYYTPITIIEQKEQRRTVSRERSRAPFVV